MPMTNKRSLIVEDNERLARMLSYLFSAKGMKVEIANNGRLALEYVKRSRPDLIILDLEMPEMNGFDFCRKIKSLPAYKEIPVLVVTGQKIPDLKERLLEVGINEYLMKPFQSANLVKMIEDIFTDLASAGNID